MPGMSGTAVCQACPAPLSRCPPGGGPLPALYLGSSDGTLRAVVVEEELDTAAPWPKAHRDAGNTGAAP